MTACSELMGERGDGCGELLPRRWKVPHLTVAVAAYLRDALRPCCTVYKLLLNKLVIQKEKRKKRHFKRGVCVSMCGSECVGVMHLYICRCVHLSECVCGQGPLCHAFLQHSSPYCLGQGLSLNLSIQFRLGWLATEPSGSACLCPQCWSHKHESPHPAFYMGAGVLNSGPLACMAGTLPLSHLPLKGFWFHYYILSA